MAGCRLNLFFIGFQIVDVKYAQLKRTGYQAAGIDSCPFIGAEQAVYKFILPFLYRFYPKRHAFELVIISLV